MSKDIDWVQKFLFIIEKKISFFALQIFCAIMLIANWYILIPKENWNGNLFLLLSNNSKMLLNVLFVIGIIDALLSSYWFWHRRIPHFNSKDIGVLFSIVTDSESVKNKIKQDFLDKIDADISKANKKIKVKILSEYRALKIINDPNNIKKIHDLSNAKMILFGRVNIRTHKGKDHYSIELIESIVHNPVNTNTQKDIRKDMVSVFPQRSLMDCGDEINGFQINHILFSYASRYILALACFFSNEFDVALELFRNVLPIDISCDNENIKNNYIRIKNNTKDFILILLHIKMMRIYNSNKNWSDIKDLIDQSKHIDKQDYNILLIEAIYYFETENIDESFKILEEARRISLGDNTWIFSKAFLQSVVGDLQGAYKSYKKVFRNMTGISTHIQCETHISETLIRKPDLYQLHYNLGLIYYFIREEFELAREEFELFIEKANEMGSFKETIPHAQHYLENILK